MRWFVLVSLLACAPEKDAGAPTAAVPCDACGGVCVTDEVPAASRSHVEGDVAYLASPPAGGDHDACWAPWAVSDAALRPENWVHNLEHGGVVLLYEPAATTGEIAELTQFLADRPPGRVVVTPYTDAMDLEGARFAAVAWERRLLLGCLDLATLSAFYDAHVGNGPEDTMSEPPGGCMES